MKSALDIVSDWIVFYRKTIGIGHSYAAQKVAEAEDAIVLVGSHRSHLEPYQRHYTDTAFVPDKPVIWDNEALIELFQDILREQRGQIPVVLSDDWRSKVCALLKEYSSTGIGQLVDNLL